MRIVSNITNNFIYHFVLYALLAVFFAPNLSRAKVNTPIDIVAELGKIKGLTFKEVVPAPVAGFRVFDMEFEQPEDHNDPVNSPKFQQRLVLWHKDETRPMVLETSGYAIFSLGLSVLATEFNGNQIQVEHRFFANSVPTDKNWDFDNIEESAGDFHNITEAFKSIYKAKWVNTGRSKGGMTSVYFRRFYPNDVDATVAHVAPHSFSTEDERYAVNMDNNIGGPGNAACREKLVQDQRVLLQNKQAILDRMTTGNYTQLGSKDEALEHAVIELPWTYWQYSGPGLDCSNVPAPDAPATDHLNFLFTNNDPTGYDDEQLAGFIPYYFQSATQLGNPGSDLNPIMDLLHFASTYKISSYVPQGVTATYDNAKAMHDVSDWLNTKSERILFIYGSWDPWAAGAYTEIRAAGDNHKFYVDKANHSAQIIDLQGPDRDLAYGKMRTWLNIANDPTRPSPLAAGARAAMKDIQTLRVKSLEYQEFEKTGKRKIL